MWYGRDDTKDENDAKVPYEPPNPTPKAKEVLEKWEKSGLLTKLSDTDKVKCALILEDAASWIKVNKRFLSQSAISSFLPLVRRLYAYEKVKPSTIDFCKIARFLNTMPLKNEEMLQSMFMVYQNIDAEVEIMALATDAIGFGYDFVMEKKYDEVRLPEEDV